MTFWLDRLISPSGGTTNRGALEGHVAEGPAHRHRHRGPKLVILDEPFSGLDPVNAAC